jgi:hypothetical protein
MRYRVLAPMTLHPGALLGLTAEQAQARSFGLEAAGAMWRVVKPVSFKAGEHIDHDGELPKQLAQVVEEVPVQPSGTGPAAAPAVAKPRKSARSKA